MKSVARRMGQRTTSLFGATGVIAVMAVLLAAASCGGDGARDERLERQGRSFASDQATLIVLSFEAELVAPWTSNPTRYVEEQLLYTVGQLNGHASVGRLDQAVLSDVTTTANGDGRLRVRYRASLPVGWGAGAPPDAFELVLPRRITPAGLSTFSATYASTCVDAPGDHSVTAGNYWYHYRPEAPGCALAREHAVRAVATVTLGAGNTSGKFPELHHVWADNALRVVAVFGKYQDGATDPADAGIQAYDAFLEQLPAQLGVDLSTTPAGLPHHPGVSIPDVTFEGRTDDGSAVRVTALLIDSPKVAGGAFDARYAALTREADVIIYDGHAGLGANVRALAQKGSFLPGRWQLFFLNGCDTFAYLDDELAKRRAVLNPDDPTGTKYMDVLTNLMPAYFSSMPSASLAVVRGLLGPPRTYQEIFGDIDEQQVVVVTGEEDNAFHPSAPPPWPGLSTTGALARDASARFETPVLAPGSYRFELRPEPQSTGGDADLYVGVGFQPTTDIYSFAPYLVGSDETVDVTLEQPARVHLLVHGYPGSEAPVSKFRLRGAVAP
jgi:hypothetical protein